MPKVSNNYFDISSLYSPKIREREIQPYKDRVEKVEVKVKANDDKNQALNELSTVVADLNRAVMAFSSNNQAGVFNLRTAGINTDDLGNGSDYINVSVANHVAQGQYDIHVDQIAKVSSVTLLTPFTTLDQSFEEYTINKGTNIDLAELRNADRLDVVITAETFNYPVQINASDTIVTIRDKINSKLAKNNIRADIVSDYTEQFLVITSTVTGKRDFQVAFKCVTFDDNGFDVEDAYKMSIPKETSQKEGADAKVTIGGVAKTSPSNTIKDIIKGITVELKKPNTSNQKNLTIGVKHNFESVASKVDDLIEAYNKFIDFAESQKKTTLVNKNLTPSDDAYLFSSSALKRATSNAKTLLNLLPELPEAMSSLRAIGIGIPSTIGIPNRIPGLPRKTKIEIFDTVKLRDAIVYKTDDVKSLLGRVCDRFASQVKNVDDRIKHELNTSSQEAASLKKQEKVVTAALTNEQNKIDRRVLDLELKAFMFQQEMDNLDMMLDLLNG